MGCDPTEHSTPDLFSTNMVRDASLSPEKPPPPPKPEADPTSQRHVLPKNLRRAVEQLTDGELDELFEVVFDQAKRRGRLPPSVTASSRRPSDLLTRSTAMDRSPRGQVNTAQVSLTRGQVNAVRAAFKAGITPSRIARQFGISQANVRKALAPD